MYAAKAACTKLSESGENLLIERHNRSAVILGIVMSVAIELRDAETSIRRVINEGVPGFVIDIYTLAVIREPDFKHELVDKRNGDLILLGEKNPDVCRALLGFLLLPIRDLDLVRLRLGMQD